MKAGLEKEKAAVLVVLAALSAVPGVAVSLFLAISLNPLVELFPANSGAHGIALGIAVMWGLVVAATVAVYAFGSVRRARRTAAGEGVETDWEDQRRFVPLAGSRALRAEPDPVYFRPEFQPEFQETGYETGAELDYRLRRMEAMMASSLRPVDYGRPGPGRTIRAAQRQPQPNLAPPLTPRHAVAPAGYYAAPRLRAQGR